MGKSLILPVCLLLVYCTPAASADPFSGNFIASHEQTEYLLMLEAAGIRRYDGEVVIGGQRFALSALRFGDRLAGQIANADARFGFTAESIAGGLLFNDESGRIIAFRRHDPGGW